MLERSDSELDNPVDPILQMDWHLSNRKLSNVNTRDKNCTANIWILGKNLSCVGQHIMADIVGLLDSPSDVIWLVGTGSQDRSHFKTYLANNWVMGEESCRCYRRFMSLEIWWRQQQLKATGFGSAHFSNCMCTWAGSRGHVVTGTALNIMQHLGLRAAFEKKQKNKKKKYLYKLTTICFVMWLPGFVAVRVSYLTPLSRQRIKLPGVIWNDKIQIKSQAVPVCDIQPCAQR